MLDVGPVLRLRILPDEDRLEAGHVLILSSRLRKLRFGSGPGVIGRSIVLDQKNHRGWRSGSGFRFLLGRRRCLRSDRPRARHACAARR